MRIALGLEYDGSDFIGWQSQASTQAEFPQGVMGVQTAVEAALSFVANHPVAIMAAGRTDSGVHATMQVIHFDTTAVRNERGWVMGANSNLKDNISVLWARPVADDFNARHTALARSYRYVILNRMPRASLMRNRVCWIRHELDAERMHRAAQALIGEHDFSSFRAAECQSPTPMRRVDGIRVTRLRDHVIIDITANAFLHHMVRNIAGVLIEVGRGDAGEDWPATVLAARNRTAGAMTAPAAGLYLCGVTYPAVFDLPSETVCSAWPPGPLEWIPDVVRGRK